MNQDNFEDAGSFPDSSLPLPGELIRKAREQRQLSLADLSERTRLTENVLDLVERDDFRAMGEPVYARGYYRKCAEVLGLNGERLIEAYEQHSGTHSPVPVIDQRPSIAYREGPGRMALGIAIGLMLLVFAICAIWLWDGDDGSQIQRSAVTESALNPPAATTAMPQQPPLEPVAQVAATQAQPTATPAMPVASPMPLQAQRPAATASPQSAIATPAAPTKRGDNENASANEPVESATASQPEDSGVDAAQLRVEIEGGDAWVEIYGQDGSKLLYKLLKPGSVRELNGPAPYRISLGRADNVRMQLNGQPLDIRAQIGAGLRAQFWLDAGGRIFEPEGSDAEDAG